MIKSFSDKETEKIFNREFSRRFSNDIQLAEDLLFAALPPDVRKGSAFPFRLKDVEATPR